MHPPQVSFSVLRRCRHPAGLVTLLLVLTTTVLLGSASSADTPKNLLLFESGLPQATIYVEGSLLNEEKVMDALRGRRPIAVPASKNGKRPYIPNDLARSAAVLELSYHLQKMSGAALPLKTLSDTQSISGPAIILGRLANKMGASPDFRSPSAEGFRIVVQDDRVLIGAESDHGLQHGVYEFLRRLGVDWVMPGEIGEIIPKRPTVAVAPMDIAQYPDFQFRRLWYRGFRPRSPEASARFGMWQQRHKGGGPRHIVESTAGHIWQKILKKHASEFEADPTMLALVRAPDGSLVRQGPQLETTHPRVIEIFVEQIRAEYEKNIASGFWTRETEAGFPIGPADGLGYSWSPEAIAAGAGRFDATLGEPDQTDQMILFANRILEAVQEDYPNAHVGYYSYSSHADYPLRYRPNPNVTQIFAPISFSRFHGVTDPVSKSRGYYRDVLENWAALSELQGNYLAFRGYNWNLADNMLPYSKIGIWGRDLPYYARNNVVGVNVEATKQWSVLAPSDYVFMRMAWDTSQDWKDLLRDFTQSAYGKGAEPMFRYWMDLTERQRTAGMEAGSYHAFPLIYDLDWVNAGQRHIADALSMADTADDRTRIGYAAYGLEFLGLYLEFNAALHGFDFAAAEQKYQEILHLWQSAHSENEDIVANEAPQYLDRFFGKYVEDTRRFSSAPYKIVARLPDGMKTAFDPYVQGERLGYHRPEIVDDQFLKTHTYSSTWDAQGLSGLRDGAVWYRWRFKPSADMQNTQVFLFLGGVEDTATVWLNGKKVGSAGPAFSKPMLFDLGKALNVRRENLLAIQITRTRKFNEIGVGGILYPSFLFAGPPPE